MHTQKGFSLIEVLVALMIVSLGLLGCLETEMWVLKRVSAVSISFI